VRVPIPLVLLLSFGVIGGVWWYGTRKTDFLTPPAEAKLAENKARVESSLPQADHPDNAVAVPVVVPDPVTPPPVEKPKSPLVLGDFNTPPTLQEYAEFASKGAAHLMDLAVLLEAEGESQRALLAWERVLDAGKADEGQTAAAIGAIKRLRTTLPPWNTDRAKTIAITLHAGTGKKNAKTLTPIVEETARELERASAGILKVTATVTAGRDNLSSKVPAPVAMWLAGPGKGAVSTPVRSFTVGSQKTLHDDLLKTVFLLASGYLAHESAQSPPAALTAGDKALDALTHQITRLKWQELGIALNRPPKKDE